MTLHFNHNDVNMTAIAVSYAMLIQRKTVEFVSLIDIANLLQSVFEQTGPRNREEVRCAWFE